MKNIPKLNFFYKQKFYNGCDLDETVSRLLNNMNRYYPFISQREGVVLGQYSEYYCLKRGDEKSSRYRISEAPKSA